MTGFCCSCPHWGANEETTSSFCVWCCVCVGTLGIPSLRGKTGMQNCMYAWADNCLGCFFSFHVTLQIALSLLPHACHSSCCAPGKKCWSLGEFSVSSLKSYSELIIFCMRVHTLKHTCHSQVGRRGCWQCTHSSSSVACGYSLGTHLNWGPSRALPLAL